MKLATERAEFTGGQHLELAGQAAISDFLAGYVLPAEDECGWVNLFQVLTRHLKFPTAGLQHLAPEGLLRRRNTKFHPISEPLLHNL